jgi:hypothetical protein
VAANVLDSIVQYTSIPVYKEEVVISPSSTELLSFPFVFMTGHKLVRFGAVERERLRRFADAGGLLFSDDCNHDVMDCVSPLPGTSYRCVEPVARTGDFEW